MLCFPLHFLSSDRLFSSVDTSTPFKYRETSQMQEWGFWKSRAGTFAVEEPETQGKEENERGIPHISVCWVLWRLWPVNMFCWKNLLWISFSDSCNQMFIHSFCFFADNTHIERHISFALFLLGLAVSQGSWLSWWFGGLSDSSYGRRGHRGPVLGPCDACAAPSWGAGGGLGSVCLSKPPLQDLCPALSALLFVFFSFTSFSFL